MAKNVYSEQFGPELTAEGLVEPILYYGDNLEILRRLSAIRVADSSGGFIRRSPICKM